MTRLEAIYILAHPRDAKNQIIPYGPPKSRRRPDLSTKEGFWRHHKAGGLPEQAIQALWDRRQEEGRQNLKKREEAIRVRQARHRKR